MLSTRWAQDGASTDDQIVFLQLADPAERMTEAC